MTITIFNIIRCLKEHTGLFLAHPMRVGLCWWTRDRCTFCMFLCANWIHKYPDKIDNITTAQRTRAPSQRQTVTHKSTETMETWNSLGRNYLRSLHTEGVALSFIQMLNSTLFLFPRIKNWWFRLERERERGSNILKNPSQKSWTFWNICNEKYHTFRSDIWIFQWNKR